MSIFRIDNYVHTYPKFTNTYFATDDRPHRSRTAESAMPDQSIHAEPARDGDRQ